MVLRKNNIDLIELIIPTAEGFNIENIENIENIVFTLPHIILFFLFEIGIVLFYHLISFKNNIPL